MYIDTIFIKLLFSRSLLILNLEGDLAVIALISILFASATCHIVYRIAYFVGHNVQKFTLTKNSDSCILVKILPPWHSTFTFSIIGYTTVGATLLEQLLTSSWNFVFYMAIQCTT